MSAIKKFQVTFDCADPERVARFWCEVLGYVVPPPPEGFATWGDFDRSLPRLGRAAQYTASAMRSTPKLKYFSHNIMRLGKWFDITSG